MAQSFTPPDPLRTGAKTLSIYVTELQDCVNQRRVEIGQVNLIAINQKVSKIMRLDAIEQLKTRTNQLAIDFGFVDGVENTELLGRPYVDHPKVQGNPTTGFPIINDLRIVLNKLSKQIPIQHFIHSWYDDGGAATPIAHYNAITNPPWKVIPDFIQTGSGSNCPEGFPTCDNTSAGAIFGAPKAVTDRSLIFLDAVPGPDVIKEGPLGGPYFIADEEFNLFKAGAGATFIALDDKYFYSHGGSSGSGGEIYRARRDASEPIELFGDFGHSFGSIRNLHVTENNIILTSSTAPSAANVIKFGRMRKADGVVEIDIDLDFTTTPLDLSNVGGPYTVVRISFGNALQRGTDIYGIYGEIFHDGGLGNRRHVVASAVVKINSVGTMSLVSDLRSVTRTVPFGPPGVSYIFGHGKSSTTNAGSLNNINSGGFYYSVRNIPATINVVTDPALPPNFADGFETFNGTAIAEKDYKDDDLFGNFMSGQLFSENYLDGIPDPAITPDIPAVGFDTATRVNVGATDKVDVTWERTDGVFRYNLQRRDIPNGSFVTTKVVESDEFIGSTYTDVVTGLSVAFAYEVRLQMETGQGLLEGTLSTLPIL